MESERAWSKERANKKTLKKWHKVRKMRKRKLLYNNKFSITYHNKAPRRKKKNFTIFFSCVVKKTFHAPENLLLFSFSRVLASTFHFKNDYFYYSQRFLFFVVHRWHNFLRYLLSFFLCLRTIYARTKQKVKERRKVWRMNKWFQCWWWWWCCLLMSTRTLEVLCRFQETNNDFTI